MTAAELLGSFWEQGGNRFIVASTRPGEVALRPLVKGMVKGARQWVPVADGNVVGYVHLPEVTSALLHCVDRSAARAAVGFLRELGMSDAFADGLTVVAPNPAPIVASTLARVGRERGWA